MYIYIYIIYIHLCARLYISEERKQLSTIALYIAMCLSYPNSVQHIKEISNISSSLRASQCRIIRPTDLSNMICIVYIDSSNHSNQKSKLAHSWKFHAIDDDKMVISFRGYLEMHNRASLWMCRRHRVVCSGVPLFNFWLGQNLFRRAHIHTILRIKILRDCWWIGSKIFCEAIVWNNGMNLNKCV